MEPVITDCTLCPRQCHADRTRGQGFCGGGGRSSWPGPPSTPGRSPALSGKKAPGTVFFSGCPLQCCFCQNYPISCENYGAEIPVERLAEIFLGSRGRGPQHQLVSAGHYAPWVAEALRLCGISSPSRWVYNSGGYESVNTLRLWRGRWTSTSPT